MISLYKRVKVDWTERKSASGPDQPGAKGQMK
jgi:hypothetical protein